MMASRWLTLVTMLDQIHSPRDLDALSYDELDLLCEEIRGRIIEVVATNSGHLGSNLGIVELTMALHRVFDSPTDAILFDTGHQAYVHKMLTGRVGDFDTLRVRGGLSGYPSQQESPHDWIENSHASTSLSYAYGLAAAEAAKASAERRRIVAVIGDGSMTGGMAYEGLNNLGHANSDVTIILNDNGRSYAPTVSRLGESLAKLRVNPKFVKQRARLEKVLGDLPVVGREVERAVDGAKAAVREMWEPTSFFEDLGVRYTGPFDGHDLEALESAIANAAKLSGPVVVHVLTRKGKGYGPAERDDVKRLHDMGSIKPGTYTSAFTEALIAEAEVRPEVVGITAAMPDSTGLLPFAERFPERFFDVGIAEQHAVTAAAGMAMGGLRPVVAVYSTFLTRAIDQVNLDVGLHKQPVVFCLDRAGVTGPDGASHHGLLDLVLLSKVPGMTILAPSSCEELQVMLHDALDIDSGPITIRWPRTLPKDLDRGQPGSGLRANRLREGGDVCILAVGKMVDAALEAAEVLASEGRPPSVWDVRCAKPLDDLMLADAAEHRLVITIEDGFREGGIGSTISDLLQTSGPHPEVAVMGVPVEYLPHGHPDEILAELGLDANGVLAQIRSLQTTW